MAKKSRDEALLKKVAQRIKELRAERNITQEDFYNDTGIHIARVETLKRDVSVTTLGRICEYLNVSMKAFFENME